MVPLRGVVTPGPGWCRDVASRARALSRRCAGSQTWQQGGPQRPLLAPEQLRAQEALISLPEALGPPH